MLSSHFYINQTKIRQNKNMSIFNFNLIAILFIVFFCVQSKYTFPNTIWLYWQQGHKNLDDIGKACESRVQQINKKNWEVKYVQDTNLQQYFDQNQMKQLDKISKFQGVRQSIISRSFFVRLMLLKKYGGVYVDTYAILLQNLDWLNDLQSNNQVMNKLQNTTPQTFLFYEAEDPELGRLNMIKGSKMTFYPTFEIEFVLIAAMKDSAYIRDLLNQLKIVHQKGQNFYNNIKDSLILFRQLKQFQTLPLANHIIQHSQFRNYQSKKERGEPSSLKDFYKVWSMNRMKGPFGYFNEKNSQILFKDIKHFAYQPKYLVKLTLDQREHRFVNYLKNDSFHKDMIMRQKNPFLFDLGQNYFLDAFSCLYKSYIDQNSIAALLIKTNSNTTSQEIKSLKISKNSQIPWICKKTTLYNMYDHFKSVWQFLYIPFYLIIVIELLIEIILGLKRYNVQLKERNLSQSNKEYLKENLYLIGVLGYTVTLQSSFMYEEVLMWYYQSPYSFQNWMLFLTVMCFVLSYFRIVKLKPFGKTITLQIFVSFVVFLLFIQQILAQHFSIWNFDGFLFHFQKLSRMNRVNNDKIFWGFLKILTMFIISKIYWSMKKYYNKNKAQIYEKIKVYVEPAKNYIKRRHSQLFGNIQQSQKLQKNVEQESFVQGSASDILKTVEESPQLSANQSKSQE